MDSKELTRVHEEKDLGVLLNDKLSWDNHIYAITARGNKMLRILKKTCPLLTNTAVRRTLYLALVRSQFSYATEVWSPSSIKLRTRVESVQRRATSWILQAKRGEISYKQRLLPPNYYLCTTRDKRLSVRF